MYNKILTKPDKIYVALKKDQPARKFKKFSPMYNIFPFQNLPYTAIIAIHLAFHI